MENLAIRIINYSDNPIPEYATTGSSGVDVRAFIRESIQLKPFERTLVSTGIYLEIPDNYEAQVRPRSGLAIKQGITCLNTPGTIDADYRGEIKIILINLSQEIQTINSGDRIAQLVFAKVEHVKFKETKNINQTKRGEGGFGHSGKN